MPSHWWPPDDEGATLFGFGDLTPPDDRPDDSGRDDRWGISPG
jgi:hypothetical protein